jgi:hypothetical protein
VPDADLRATVGQGLCQPSAAGERGADRHVLEPRALAPPPAATASRPSGSVSAEGDRLYAIAEEISGIVMRSARSPRTVASRHTPPSRLGPLRRSNEHLARNVKAPMQPPDHGQGERAYAIEDLVHATSRSDHTDQRPTIKPELLEAKMNGVDGAGPIDRMTGVLIRLDESEEILEPITAGVCSGGPHRRSISRRVTS